MPVVMDMRVECCAGYQAEETPRRLIFDDRTVEVADVIDPWLAPNHRYFKLRGTNGAAYIIRRDVENRRYDEVEAVRAGEAVELADDEAAIDDKRNRIIHTE